MKLMTFNTQHCLSYQADRIDFALMAKTILDCGADVVGLNEMRDLGAHPEYAAQVETLARLTGMPYFYFAKAIDFEGSGPYGPVYGPYGNGFLSKFPILSAETIPIPDPETRGYDGYYETRCLLKAKLANGLTVLVTHFGLNPDEQENAVRTILAHLPEERCVLMGDFNLLPEDPILAPIRSRMQDTADCFSQPKLSFPSDLPDRKIDYIFVSPDLRVLDADIPAVVASDHRPHTATIEA